MKKFLSIILSIFIIAGLATGFSSYAVEIKTSGDYEYSLYNNNTVRIVSYKGNDKEVTIPDMIDGYNVVNIGLGAFSRCFNLESVVISENIERIEQRAFNSCVNLKSVEIGRDVVNIDESSFSGCDALSNITVKNKNTVYDSRDNCNAIIETKSNTLKIGCSKTVIPNSVATIGENAFDNCFDLKTIEIPSNVKMIGREAFVNCMNLEKITLSEGLEQIGDSAFRGCLNLKNVEIPNSVTKLGFSVFMGCTNLTNVALPEKVTTINNFVFSDCVNLESVKLPQKTEIIGDEVFANCSSLKTINLPESIRRIGFSSFNGCENLTDVYYGGSEYSWKNIDMGDKNDSLQNAKIHFEKESPTNPTTESTPATTTPTETVQPTTSATENPEPANSKNITDVIPAGAQTNTYYFYKPKDWDNVGVYWFSGSYNCEKDENKSNGKGYPGYAVTQTEESDKNIYIVKIPKDVPSISFNNLLDGEKSVYTTNLSCADNASKVFIVNPNSKIEDETNTVRGEWFYYYRNGKYGRYKTFDEAQKNNAVYSNGEVPKKISDKNTTPTVSKPKQANPIKVTAKTKTVKAKKLKRTKVTVNALTVKKAKGEVKYKKLGGSKKLTVNKKGKITIKKGTKKGTYKIKIKITAKGTKKYKSKTVTKKVTVKVK